MNNRRIRILNINFSCLSKEEFFSNENIFRHFITINSEILIKIIRKEKLYKIFKDSNSTIDSQLLYLYLKFKFWKTRINKLSGSDLVFDIISDAKKNKRSILLFGSSQMSNSKAIEKIKNKNIKVGGFSPKLEGYELKNDDYHSFINLLKDLRPYYLLVGLGCPKQEYFINRYKKDLIKNDVKLAVGIGGAIDFISGVEIRAPQFFVKFGLEWFFRLTQSPQRIYRTIKINYIFLILFKDFIYSFKNKIFNNKSI